MAQVTICDSCGMQIGTRSADHTNYGNVGYKIQTTDTINKKLGYLQKAVPVLAMAQQVGRPDICDICIQRAALIALTVPPALANYLIADREPQAEQEYEALKLVIKMLNDPDGVAMGIRNCTGHMVKSEGRVRLPKPAADEEPISDRFVT